MKGAIFYAKHDLRVEEKKMPAAGQGQVIVKVMACGICGTDVHIFEGDKGAADTPPGTILGHEFSGIVDAVGEGVTSCQVGDRVCVDPNALCGQCRFCKDGQGHFCENMVGTGTTEDGGFAQFCLVDQKQVYHLEDHISYAAGAMAEPLACCLHGIDLCEIQPGQNVLVIGGGMIGLLMIQLARLCGAAIVALAEPVESRRQMGLDLGAAIAIDPTSADLKSALIEAGIDHLHCVIECAGRTAAIGQAIDVAGKGATVMMFGLTKPDEEIAVKPFTLFQKEITLRSSFINPYTMGRAVQLINQERVDVTSMIAETIPLEELGSVLSDPKRRSLGKFIVEP